MQINVIWMNICIIYWKKLGFRNYGILYCNSRDIDQIRQYGYIICYPKMFQQHHTKIIIQNHMQLFRIFLYNICYIDKGKVDQIREYYEIRQIHYMLKKCATGFIPKSVHCQLLPHLVRHKRKGRKCLKKLDWNLIIKFCNRNTNFICYINPENAVIKPQWLHR